MFNIIYRLLSKVNIWGYKMVYYGFISNMHMYIQKIYGHLWNIPVIDNLTVTFGNLTYRKWMNMIIYN